MTTAAAIHSERSAFVSVFRTLRLRVRTFAATDAEAFVAYRADPAVARYQSWRDYTLEDGRELIQSMRHVVPRAPGLWYQFALESCAAGDLLGDVALKVNESEPTQAEIGFTLAATNQGRGYGAEAGRGLLGYAFQTLRLRRVIAVTDASNHPAAALLERVGMRREAHHLDNTFSRARGEASLSSPSSAGSGRRTL